MKTTKAKTTTWTECLPSILAEAKRIRSEVSKQPRRPSSSHTPGPWETSRDAVPEGHTQITVYAESDGERVATVFRNEGNALLVKAAPDLLEACKDMEAIASLINARQHAGCSVRPDDWSDLYHCCNKAKAAIAKATQP